MRYIKSIIIPVLVSLAPAVYASTGGTVGIVSAPTNIIASTQDVTKLLCTTMDWMFWVLIALSVIMFLVGGYNYVTAADNPQRVSKANKIMLYAAIAVVVAILAKGLPMTIAGFFGVTITTC